MDKSFHAQKSVFPRPRILMKRFLSSRSSSQQELQPLDDVRAERAANALSVGLSWPPDRYTLVEDEPSGSGSKRRKVQVDPIARDWFLDMLGQWRRERRWDMQRCLCEVQRLCPGMFHGINPNTPYRWKRSAARAEKRGRRTLLSLADTTRLS